MGISFNCPSCSHVVRVVAERAGKTAHCEHCGEICRVPAAKRTEQSTAPQPVQPAPSASGVEPRRRSLSRVQVVALAGVGVLVLCFVIYGAVSTVSTVPRPDRDTYTNRLEQMLPEGSDAVILSEYDGDHISYQVSWSRPGFPANRASFRVTKEKAVVRVSVEGGSWVFEGGALLSERATEGAPPGQWDWSRARAIEVAAVTVRALDSGPTGPPRRTIRQVRESARAALKERLSPLLSAGHQNLEVIYCPPLNDELMFRVAWPRAGLPDGLAEFIVYKKGNVVKVGGPGYHWVWVDGKLDEEVLSDEGVRVEGDVSKGPMAKHLGWFRQRAAGVAEVARQMPD